MLLTKTLIREEGDITIVIDEYGITYNNESTYQALAYALHNEGSVLFAWTDQQGTLLSILLCYKPLDLTGLHQRGIEASDLFVSVIGLGSFGFDLVSYPDTHPGYYSEKLNLGGVNATTVALAELINNVRKELNKLIV